MQANVREILTVANGVNSIVKVADRPKGITDESIPAFVILGRSKEFESSSLNNKHYTGAWEYQCMIVTDLDNDNPGDHQMGGDDYLAAEAIATAFFTAMFGDGEWRLEGLLDYSPYQIEGMELIGVSFTLAKDQSDRF